MRNNQKASPSGSPTSHPSTYDDQTGEVHSTTQRSSGSRQRMVLREVLDAAISLIDTDDDLIKIGAILGNPLRSIHQEEEDEDDDYNNFADLQQEVATTSGSSPRNPARPPILDILSVLDTAVSMEMESTNQKQAEDDQTTSRQRSTPHRFCQNQPQSNNHITAGLYSTYDETSTRAGTKREPQL